MKSVLISVNPKWCRLIANGNKTIEVRKSKPKISVPFKCYIYETKGYKIVGTVKSKGTGKVIGEFACNGIDDYTAEFVNGNMYEDIRLNYFDKESEEKEQILITSNEYDNPSNCWLCKKSCLSFDKIKKYVFNEDSGFFDFYGWHISDLIIYDKPKELSEFCRLEKVPHGAICSEKYFPAELQRPPQSWCYAEVLKDE